MYSKAVLATIAAAMMAGGAQAASGGPCPIDLAALDITQECPAVMDCIFSASDLIDNWDNIRAAHQTRETTNDEWLQILPVGDAYANDWVFTIPLCTPAAGTTQVHIDYKVSFQHQPTNKCFYLATFDGDEMMGVLGKKNAASLPFPFMATGDEDGFVAPKGMGGAEDRTPGTERDQIVSMSMIGDINNETNAVTGRLTSRAVGGPSLEETGTPLVKNTGTKLEPTSPVTIGSVRVHTKTGEFHINRIRVTLTTDGSYVPEATEEVVPVVPIEEVWEDSSIDYESMADSYMGSY